MHLCYVLDSEQSDVCINFKINIPFGSVINIYSCPANTSIFNFQKYSDTLFDLVSTLGKEGVSKVKLLQNIHFYCFMNLDLNFI